MKTVITRILLWATLLTTVFCLLPTQTQAAQPGQLEDYVDPAAFSAYLKEAFYDLAENTPYLSDTIDLRQYQIPATDALWEETTRAAVLALPELNLVGHYYIYDDGTYLSSLSISFYSGLKDPVYFEAIERAGNGLLYGVEDNTVLSEAERALILHDRLAVWTAYDYENYLNDTVPGISYTGYGALVERVAVCSGYADAYGYLLARAGIYSYTTTSASLDHEWNIVYIDGIPYHADVTWDDPAPDRPGYVKHENFLRSTQGFVQTGHVGAMDYDTTPTDTTYDQYYWQQSGAAFQLLGNDLYFIYSNKFAIYRVSGGQVEYFRSTDTYGCLGTIEDRLLYGIGSYIYYYDFEIDEERFVIDLDRGRDYSLTGWVYERSHIVATYYTKDPQTGLGHYETVSHFYALPAKTGWQNDPFGDFYYDENRQRVCNTWLKDDVDWRFLGDDGYVVYNQWCTDASGTFYANRKGYLGRDMWVTVYTGAAYKEHRLDQDGLIIYDTWLTLDGELYLIDEEGYRVESAWVQDDGGWRYMDLNGCSIRDTWHAENGKVYYLDAQGYRYSGRLELGEVWAWFDENGVRVENCWFRDDTGRLAYANNTGYVYSDRWYAYDGQAYNSVNRPNAVITDNGLTYYYVGEGGYQVTGWREFSGDWYYFDSAGPLVHSQWVTLSDGIYCINDKGCRVDDCWIYVSGSTVNYYSYSSADFYGGSGQLYYLDKDGRLSFGWKQIDGYWFWFDENGVKVNNRWIRDSQGWCYLGNGGNMLYNAWVADSKGMCYLDPNGRMKESSWVYYENNWYYVDANGRRVYDWQRVGGKWYYFLPSGIMADNAWVYDTGTGYSCYSGFSSMSLAKYPHYYLTSSGAMATGWHKISDRWFWFDSAGLMVKNKWVRDSVGWCYLGKDGIMLTNCWKQDSKGWCYIGDSGYILTNKWLQQSGTWYYLDSAGYRATGWKQLGGKWYYFYSSGAMATSTYMDGGWIDGNGVWRAS